MIHSFLKSLLINEIVMFPDTSSFPVIGNKGIFYIDESTGAYYVWNGSAYVLSTGGNFDFYEESGNVILKLADAVGANALVVKNSLGTNIFKVTSDGIITCGDEATNGDLKVKNSSAVTKIELDSTAGITNKLGRIDAGITVVNSASYSMLSTDYIAHVTYTATGAVAVTLPSARVAEIGRLYTVKDAGLNAFNFNITIGTEGSEKIDGQDTFVIATNGTSISVYSDGSNWFIY